jgi:signal peptidase I
MSRSSFENDDSPTLVFRRLDQPADNSVSSADASSGSGPAAGRGTAVRAPEEVDRRLRGLHAEPAAQVTATLTATPTRTDQHHHYHLRGPVVAKVAVFLAVAALALVLLQMFVIQPFAVPGDAMTPTLQAGDRILVLKSGLLEGPIRSGEIVVFHPPRPLPCTVVGGSGSDLVLRVMALPGDTIWSVGETIFVDGRPLQERGWYYARFGQVGSTPIRSTTLAPGQYFVMADNRSDACDSRVFGPIPKSSVVGEAIAIVGRHGHVYLGSL